MVTNTEREKKLLLGITSTLRVPALIDSLLQLLVLRSHEWEKRESVILYNEFQEVLAEAVCSWAGVPLRKDERRLRTMQLSTLYDQAAALGWGHVQSRFVRHGTERWLASIIDGIRNGAIIVPPDYAAYSIAAYRDIDGKLLKPRVAAVELLNILRPTVAVSVYCTFCALALYEHPKVRERLRYEPGYEDLFAQEVRRFFPFFPAVSAKVRQDFEWNGYQFRKDWKALFDLHGTNHDPRAWDRPEQFDPDRFRTTVPTADNLVRQGGGDPHVTHRCPGEHLALEIIKLTARFLLELIDYEVPEQRLRIDRKRLPAIPASGFVISNVKDRREKNDSWRVMIHDVQV